MKGGLITSFIFLAICSCVVSACDLVDELMGKINQSESESEDKFFEKIMFIVRLLRGHCCLVLLVGLYIVLVTHTKYISGMTAYTPNPMNVRPANYVRHLNGFLKRIEADTRLAPPHISLYLELFRVWNMKRFQNPIQPIPELSMNMSKIRSRTTYRKTLRELRDYGYIRYSKSSSNRAAVIEMLPFDSQAVVSVQTGDDQPENSACSDSDQNMTDTPIINTNTINLKTNGTGVPASPASGNDKYIRQNQPRGQPVPQSLEEAQEFFRSNGSDTREAEIFFHHYASIGWRIGNLAITDWHAAARKWIARPPFATSNKKPNNTHVNTDKDYGTPL